MDMFIYGHEHNRDEAARAIQVHRDEFIEKLETNIMGLPTTWHKRLPGVPKEAAWAWLAFRFDVQHELDQISLEAGVMTKLNTANGTLSVVGIIGSVFRSFVNF